MPKPKRQKPETVRTTVYLGVADYRLLRQRLLARNLTVSAWLRLQVKKFLSESL